MEHVILEWIFLVGSSNKLQKLSLEGKSVERPQYPFTLSNLEIFNSENVSIKNVFTLGPTTQATLMYMN